MDMDVKTQNPTSKPTPKEAEFSYHNNPNDGFKLNLIQELLSCLG